MSSLDYNIIFAYVNYNDADELKEALVHNHVDPNITDRDGWSLLHIACRLGRFECMKVLLNDSRTNVNIKGPGSVTPVFISVEQNRPKYLNVLLKHPNINVNIFNGEFMTPLHFAVLKGYIDCIRELLGCPTIDLDCRDKDGRTAADLVRASTTAYKQEILKLLCDDARNEVPLLPQPSNFLLPPPPLTGTIQATPQNAFQSTLHVVPPPLLPPIPQTSLQTKPSLPPPPPPPPPSIVSSINILCQTGLFRKRV